MTTVNTVTGPLEAGRLGFTLMHEHIVVSSWAMRQSYPGWFNRDIVVKQAVDALKAARACGVGAFVDVTPAEPGPRRRSAVRSIRKVRYAHRRCHRSLLYRGALAGKVGP